MRPTFLYVVEFFGKRHGEQRRRQSVTVVSVCDSLPFATIRRLARDLAERLNDSGELLAVFMPLSVNGVSCIESGPGAEQAIDARGIPGRLLGRPEKLKLARCPAPRACRG
jgi:hypothetical protein